MSIKFYEVSTKHGKMSGNNPHKVNKEPGSNFGWDFRVQQETPEKDPGLYISRYIGSIATKINMLIGMIKHKITIIACI